MAEILSDKLTDIDSVFTRRPAENKRSLFLVMGGDKGMAGGYNFNIIKFLSEKVDKKNSDILMAGFVGRNRATREGYNIDPGFQFSVMDPNLDRAHDMADIVIEKYLSGRYREADLIYTKAETALSQKPVYFPLLPLNLEHFMLSVPPGAGKFNSFYFEPNPAEVFDSLAPHYVKGIIYAALVEANTSELQARMIAMENATNNAEDIIDSLSLRYNRARQAIITQEITEIVSGMPE
jgi:F-type H+-transporting ATPase subunit gamma